MSYSAPRFLTVIFILATAGATLFAQRDFVRTEMEHLAAPVAHERAAAVARLVAIDDDIAADLRVAFRFNGAPERVGLLKVARLRNSDALVQQAAESLGAEDTALNEEARAYLLALPADAMAPDTAVLGKAQLRRWNEFKDFRLRLEISFALIGAYLKPGKFLGQFDELRALDPQRLDTELLSFLTGDTALVDPLNAAVERHVNSDVPPEHRLRPAWRSLASTSGALKPAMMYVHQGELTDEVDSAREPFTEASFRAALEVVGGVRSAAARALAASKRGPELLRVLPKYYDSALDFKPEAALSDWVRQDELVVEIELTLARLGDATLLDARVSALRGRIDQFERVKGNVHLRPSSRPDLLAQNQIAHLLLRAGDAEKAESEWKASVRLSRELMRDAQGRNRESLSSYLATVYYNLACAQSLQFKQSEAQDSIEKAVEYGYKDFNWMLEDGDLEYLRRSPAFRQWFLDAAPPSVASALRNDS